MTEHTYPSNYPPGTHWAIDAAWEILDLLKPGAMSDEARALIAGAIAGRLVREREETEKRTASSRSPLFELKL